MGLKKPSRALIPLHRRPNTNANSDNTTTRGHDSPTCGDYDAENGSECGDDGHNDEDDDCTPITGKDYTQHQFWNYVDDYLNLIHTKLFQDMLDTAARHSKIIWYYSLLLSCYFAHTLIASQGSSTRDCK